MASLKKKKGTLALSKERMRIKTRSALFAWLRRVSAFLCPAATYAAAPIAPKA
jgi:hypothetical protein